MKKKILFGTLVFALLITVGYGVRCMNSQMVFTDLALENMEALAQNEGGTSADVCYLQGYGSASAYKIFCDSGTNDNTIYKCPSNTTFGSYSEMSKDRCIK